MNISAPQYSKAIASIKNRNIPDIKDIHTKLIFIYPFFCDIKFKEYLDSIRDFYTVTVLRDLYVNNALNFVKIASHISPLVDEEGNPIVPPSDFFGSYSKIHYAQLQQYNQELAKEHLKSAINRKLLFIKQLVNVDPQFKQFRPHLEVITLNNFIQVPVIVGTKPDYFDDFYMLMFLSIAIVSGYSLSDINDVKKCFGHLRSLKNKNVSNIVSTVFANAQNQKTNKNLVERFLGYLSDKFGFTKLMTKISSLKSSGHNMVTKFTKGYNTNIQNALSNVFNNTQTQKMDEMIDKYFSDMNEVSKFEKKFIGLMDQQKAASDLGYEFTDMESVFSSSNAKIDVLYLKMTKVFSETIWSDIIYKIIKSYAHVVFPFDYTKFATRVDALTPQHESFASIKNKYLDGLNSDLQENMCKLIYGGKTNFKDIVNNILKSKSTTEVFETFKTLESTCSDIFDKHESFVSDVQNFINTFSIRSFTFNYDKEFLSFCRGLENLSSSFIPVIESIIKDINVVVPKNFIENLISEIDNFVSDFLDQNDDLFINNIPETGLYESVKNKVGAGQNVDAITKEAYRYFRKLFYESFSYILKYFYFYICRIILCSYVSTSKIKVETAKNDFLSFPNYSLVLNLDIVIFLINALTIKGLKNFYNAENQTIDSTYLKLTRYVEDKNYSPVIGFFAELLNIPNLFVIDSKTNTLYYKLQNTSKTLKINLGSLNSYINQIKNINSNIMMGDI